MKSDCFLTQIQLNQMMCEHLKVMATIKKCVLHGINAINQQLLHENGNEMYASLLTEGQTQGCDFIFQIF